MTVLAWRHAPTWAELHSKIKKYNDIQHIIIGLENQIVPNWDIFQHADSPYVIQFNGVNFLPNLLNNQIHFWFMPEYALRHLAEHFDEQTVQQIDWQDEIVPQENIAPLKVWLQAPEHYRPKPKKVIVIGAGISGASTAYELAQRGIEVIVLEEKNQVALGASGNYQGLIYAKISPNNTEQTELLSSSYTFTRAWLNRILDKSDAWGATGVLHLNHDEAEQKRNEKLATQTWHRHWFYGVSLKQATDLSGIYLNQDGLFFPKGAWLNPPDLIQTLLNHELIDLKLNSPILSAKFDFDKENWLVHTPNQIYEASHLVFCVGADSAKTPIIQDFPLQMIRGQTSIVTASPHSLSLKIALSSSSYIAPAWQGKHCFGATFLPNDTQSDWREHDEQHNRQALQNLLPEMANNWGFHDKNQGHAAIRCDAYDHLPVVGALGDASKMREIYAKLALDKNYRISEKCPYLPNVYINTAHGSRGLTTAPFCATQLAAQICGEANVFSQRLQRALNPNRLIIKEIIQKTKPTPRTQSL